MVTQNPNMANTGAIAASSVVVETVVTAAVSTVEAPMAQPPPSYPQAPGPNKKSSVGARGSKGTPARTEYFRYIRTLKEKFKKMAEYAESALRTRQVLNEANAESKKRQVLNIEREKQAGLLRSDLKVKLAMLKNSKARQAEAQALLHQAKGQAEVYEAFQAQDRESLQALPIYRPSAAVVSSTVPKLAAVLFPVPKPQGNLREASQTRKRKFEDLENTLEKADENDFLPSNKRVVQSSILESSMPLARAAITDFLRHIPSCATECDTAHLSS
mmetsp:Transcript_21087/g.29192  ORF Transcript_21087/g.29192 Transcript_21087/m.29192 type:complete len:273 (-) Transcript_21087:272-1090(-)